MKSKIILALFVLAAALQAGCATKRVYSFRVSPDAPESGRRAKFDYSHYAAIPDTPTSRVLRVVLMSNPYTRAKGFYGNWAGSGNRGGIPVDVVDEIYRRHDIVYAEAETVRTMRWADRASVDALARLDERDLSPAAVSYRDRAQKFFQNKSLSWIGKPVSAFFRFRERADCPFQCEADVRELFGLNGARDSIRLVVDSRW